MIRNITAVVLLLSCTSCVSPLLNRARHPSARQFSWFEENSNLKGLSSDAISNMKIHEDMQHGEGVFRAVMNLPEADFDWLSDHPFFNHWSEYKIPNRLWKSTVMLGQDREPPEVFYPDYGARLWWLYIAHPDKDEFINTPRRLYIIEFSEDNKAWKLYYIYVVL